MRAQRVPEQGRAQLFEHCLHVQPALSCVGDAEDGGDAEQPSPFTHHAETERVVIGERCVVAERSVCPLHARPHLVRGLARVGEHELPSGTDTGGGQPVKSLDDDARLAAARPGDDEAWAVAVIDRDALLIVERGGGGVREREFGHRSRFWADATTAGCRAGWRIRAWRRPAQPARHLGTRRCAPVVAPRPAHPGLHRRRNLDRVGHPRFSGAERCLEDHRPEALHDPELHQRSIGARGALARPPGVAILERASRMPRTLR